MFQVKICGITNIDDALAVSRAGADAVGLNFYSKSPRYVTPDQARTILAALPAGIIKVGVFVDASAGEICDTFDRLKLDLIQLHGDQPPEFLQKLGGRPAMQAFRIGPAGLDPVVQYLRVCDGMAHRPISVLLDSYSPIAYGGTGIGCNYNTIADYHHSIIDTHVVLAGGLTAHNVAGAIHAVRPAAVDTASGVESSPGKKDHAAVAAFVREARAAFAEL